MSLTGSIFVAPPPECKTVNLDHPGTPDYASKGTFQANPDEQNNGWASCYRRGLEGQISEAEVTWTGEGTWSPSSICFDWDKESFLVSTCTFPEGTTLKNGENAVLTCGMGSVTDCEALFSSLTIKSTSTKAPTTTAAATTTVSEASTSDTKSSETPTTPRFTSAETTASSTAATTSDINSSPTTSLSETTTNSFLPKAQTATLISGSPTNFCQDMCRTTKKKLIGACCSSSYCDCSSGTQVTCDYKHFYCPKEGKCIIFENLQCENLSEIGDNQCCWDEPESLNFNKSSRIKNNAFYHLLFVFLLSSML